MVMVMAIIGGKREREGENRVEREKEKERERERERERDREMHCIAGRDNYRDRRPKAMLIYCI
jgi:hypothetical protein